MWLSLAIAVLGLLTGPVDPEAYPPRADSPYVLPWDPGVVRLCVQGNRGIVSHRASDGPYAWDFAMPVGANIRAARGGKVVAVTRHHDGRGRRAPNNRIVIDHGDGTRASYLHLRKNGVKVAPDQEVARGEVIAECGNVGRSLLPHLHFHVTRDGESIPVSFRDASATRHRGIPRMGARYRAGDAP